MTSFGGAVHFIRPISDQPVPAYDVEGISQALRIALYIQMLSAEYDLMDKLGEKKDIVFTLIQVTVRLVHDCLSIAGANGLWKPSNAAVVEPVVLEFASDFGVHTYSPYLAALPRSLISPETSANHGYLFALGDLREHHGESSHIAYYASLVESDVNIELFERHGSTNNDTIAAEQFLKDQRKEGGLLSQLYIILGLQQPLSGSQTLKRYWNELVADLTDIDFTEDKDSHGLKKLIILNAILGSQEDAITTIAKQRLIFLVKKLLPGLESNAALTVKSEVCKLLTELMPGMADMYGEHWAQTITILCNYWKSLESEPEAVEVEQQIVMKHASLKLLAVLNKLAKVEDPNDDLVDALKDSKDGVRKGLVGLLRLAADEKDEAHQPLMITHELLARQINALPTASTQDLDDLYPLMYAQSRAIQQAAFDLLHQQIPAAQEQISLDAALENRTAQLPDELLSLILEAPTLDSLVDESFDTSMPRSLQGYLFSWRLLFDHFNGSSFRVKNDYIEQLKDGTYLPDLLHFVFDFLGHSRGKPVDVSKLDVQHYAADSESSPEKDVQWLLAHLYYLALTHIPTLVKDYYLNIRSRQTKLAVESWTSKHLSPLIISAALQDVATWAEKTVKDEPEYENMTVKVGMKSKEINVSYLIDEQLMAMRVILPEAYPLDFAHVQGVNRVAVKEEKWQSWLRNCQGVITFSVSAPLLLHLMLLMILTLQKERQHHRRPVRLAQERHWRSQRAVGVCDLLLDHLGGQAVAAEEVPDVQESVSFELFVQVVQDEQCEYLSVVSDGFQFQLKCCWVAEWDQWVERGAVEVVRAVLSDHLAGETILSYPWAMAITGGDARW